MATGKKTAIDGGRSFVNAEDDHDYEKPVYGVAGFSADGKSALLYDRYDVWALPLAGGTADEPHEGRRREAGRSAIASRSSDAAAVADAAVAAAAAAAAAQEPIDLTQAGHAVGVRRVDEEVRLLRARARAGAGAAHLGRQGHRRADRRRRTPTA